MDKESQEAESDPKPSSHGDRDENVGDEVKNEPLTYKRGKGGADLETQQQSNEQRKDSPAAQITKQITENYVGDPKAFQVIGAFAVSPICVAGTRSAAASKQRCLAQQDAAILNTKEVSTVQVANVGLPANQTVRHHQPPQAVERLLQHPSHDRGGGGIVDDVQPLPPTTTLFAQHHRMLRGYPVGSDPGAFPIGGQSSNEEQETAAEEIITEEREEPFQMGTSSAYAGGTAPSDCCLSLSIDQLVQARAIQEASSRELGRAFPVFDNNHNNLQPQTSTNNKEGKRHLVVCLTFFVLIVLGVVVTVAVSIQQSKTNNKDHSNDVEATLNPTTLVPTLEPTPLVLDLPAYTLTVLQEDLDGTSPQSKAYQWLLSDPHLDTYSEQRRVQRFALAVFYFSTGGIMWINQQAIEEPDPVVGAATNQTNKLRGPQGRPSRPDPDGPKPYIPPGPCGSGGPPARGPVVGNSSSAGYGSGSPLAKQPPSGGGGGGGGCYKNRGFGSVWLNTSDECSWYAKTENPEVTTCDEDQVFENLFMTSNGLVGSIPKELALLSALKRIEIDRNELSGLGLRKEWIESWFQIEDIRILRNNLVGSIPSEIGMWNNTLRELRILGNDFTGTIPAELYSLSRLESCVVVDNVFSGTLPGVLLPGLQSLQSMELVNNQFSGTLPTECGLLDTLKVIAIHNNLFTGTIPTELGLLTDVLFLSLGDNNFESTLPSELGLLDLSITFNVKGNPSLAGSIPPELAAKTIMNIYLQDTGLTGTIPELWCNTSKILKWTCSDVLCGCDCPCQRNNTVVENEV